MTSNRTRPQSAFGAALLCVASSAAWAQQQSSNDPPSAQDALPASADALGFEEVVVTGTSGERTKMRSSVSVTGISTDAVIAAAPRSEAEVFRNIPGIRAESTGGPGGNANITVRGLPISTGGSKFLQLQEDGLPITQFGDIAFANNDVWTRFDYNVERVEAVRGGSASTFTSNAPGGIINYISKTGERAGGGIGLSTGLDYDETRVDFDYGSPFGEHWNFHVGGFYRKGEGPREAGYDAVDGYQLKGNITRGFADDSGYVRLYAKILDDRAPTYSALPFLAEVNGNRVGNYSAIPGLDARGESSLSRLNQSILTVGANNQPIRGDVTDGVHAKSNAVGLEASYDFNEVFSIINRFRYDDQDGVFYLQRLPAGPAASVIAAVGGPGATARFANGPFAGQLLTADNTANTYLSDAGIFFTEIPDLSNYANDLSVTGNFPLDEGELTAKLGYYLGGQNIATIWHQLQYVQETRGPNAAFVDIFNSAGVRITENGVRSYNVGPRNYDLDYEINAPYLSLGMERRGLNIDASVRYDRLDASGRFIGGQPGVATLDVNGDGQISGPDTRVSLYNNAAPQPVDYDVDYWSWSIGGNYLLTPDVSLFVRASRGGRGNADRLVPGAAVSPVTGNLVPQFASAAVDFVKQQEAGIKLRNDAAWGNLDVFATLFRAELTEHNFDLIRNETIDQDYEAYGVELEASYQVGDFSLRVSTTYTDAEITADPLSGNTGNRPRGQPEWIFSLSPQYSIGRATFGLNVIGQSGAYTGDNNGLYGEGYEYVNAFLNMRVFENVQIGISANNVFNTWGQAGRLNQTLPGQIVNGLAVNRPELGRTVTGSISYSF